MITGGREHNDGEEHNNSGATTTAFGAWTMGEVSRMSESTCGPGGTVTRCELSSELTALSSASSFEVLSASSPKLTMSSATEFFFSFLPSFTCKSRRRLGLCLRVR